MSLTSSLVGVFVAFCLLMAGVLGFCLLERRRTRQQAAPSAHDADRRVVKILLSAMLMGAVLALVTAWLVFGREWN